MSEHVIFCGRDVTKPWSGRVFVSPDDANTALARNQGNRRHREMAVEYLAKVISSGEWQNDHPQPIVFSDTGRLIDGQHRLMAIAKSGVGVWIAVVFGARDDLQKHIDNGVVRALQDRVKFDACPQTNRYIATIVRTSFSLDPKISWSNSYKMTPEQAIAFFKEHEESLIFAANFLATGQRFVCKAPVAVAVMELFEKSKDGAVQFVESLCSPDGPVQQARMLRDCLLSSRTIGFGGGKMIQGVIYKKCVSAMRAFLEGKEVKQIKARDWK